jgi:hypothetical protein
MLAFGMFTFGKVFHLSILAYGMFTFDKVFELAMFAFGIFGSWQGILTSHACI